jgi:hypothetical protein
MTLRTVVTNYETIKYHKYKLVKNIVKNVRHKGT